jgi:site-specific DNA-methyltransferase (cytosine-N4-specific)
MPKSDLPFGSEFSPKQIQLPEVLVLAEQHGGDWNAFELAVRDRYFAGHDTNDYNKRKLANNTKLAMIAYGIIDRDAKLTSFGEQLLALKDDQPALHDELAKQILKNLHGVTLVQCVLDMQAGAEEVDLEKLRAWLDERGIHFPRGGKHPSIMRLWLERAGVFATGWRVNEDKMRDLLGLTIDEIEKLAGLSMEQRTYLKAIANLPSRGPYPSNEIERLATATYGVRFSEKGLPKTVLYPLEQAGYITLERGTKEEGRGAKPFMVTATEKAEAEVIEPLMKQLEQQTAADLRPLLRKPLSEILADLIVEDRHRRGLALEALAFKLMRLVDLTYVATRLRGAATGGGEVDLVFESSRLVFSRWQIQCKNTDRVSLDDVAKEVGLTHLLKSNVIVMVSTGDIGQEARKYANKVMTDSNLCIVMVDRTDIQAIEQRPAAIIDVFNREARYAMRIKAFEA